MPVHPDFSGNEVHPTRRGSRPRFRRLPHIDGPGLTHSLTFRLADSVPLQVIDRWRERARREHPDQPPSDRSIRLLKAIERYSDAGYGRCWLSRPDIARVVRDALLHWQGRRYELPAWCIMPNHVHALVRPMSGWVLREIVRSWKTFTAREANRCLGRVGPFWMPDYFDRYIRHPLHLAEVVEYIESNPVKAGLVERPELWAWSSATGDWLR